MSNSLQLPLLFASPEAASEPLLPEEVRAALAAVATLSQSASTEPHVADLEERNQALDVHASFIVEAPAGSGKTGLLTHRFLRLLARGGVTRPEDVLAITFTRKAEAEMRRRILEELENAARSPPAADTLSSFKQSLRATALEVLARDQASTWGLLSNPQQLNIRTIDSLCAELARSQPLLAGSGGRYQPTDDPEPLYLLAAERTLLRLSGDDPVLSADLEHLLAHRDANAQDVLALIGDMLRNREQWGELIPVSAEKLTDEALDADVLPRIQATLKRLLRQELTAVEEAVGPGLLERLSEVGHRLSACAPHDAAMPMPFDCFAHLHSLSSDPQDLERWQAVAQLVLTSAGWRKDFRDAHLKCRLTKPLKEELKDLALSLKLQEAERPDVLEQLLSIRNAPHAEFPERQWKMVRSLCRILQEARLQLQIVFGERRSCDFAEISLNARTLLATGSDALTSAIGGTRHLLVDEMQDTSAGQYELLQMLTEHWDAPSHTVFLVGDPKQSIYEFRLARVERFRQVVQSGRFGQIQVRPLQLTSNFRSSANLVEAVNDVFRAVLPSKEELANHPASPDVPFIAATPQRGNSPDARLCWHLAPEAGSDEAADGSSPQQQAREIREVIEQFLRDRAGIAAASSSKASAPSIAILGRNRSHLASVAQVLSEDWGSGSLPFRAIDVEPLQDRPEIRDMLALVRALLHTADRTAWLAVLRSPVCGLSLADLLLLVGEGDAECNGRLLPDLIGSRLGRLSADGQLRLARTWSVLQTAWERRGQTTFPVAVERCWRSLGGDLGLQEAEKTNVMRFLDLLSTVDRGSETFHLSLFLRQLKKLYATPEASGASIDLLTIHKAKGLEWDLVLVPELHRGSVRPGAELLKWLEFSEDGGRAEFFLVPVPEKGSGSCSLSQWLDRKRRDRATAEARRLLYVACTRAREEVHLFGRVKKGKESFCEPTGKESLLSAAWPVAQHHLPAESVTVEPIPAPEAQPARVLQFPGKGSPDTTGFVLDLAATAPESRDCSYPLRRLPLSVQPVQVLQQRPAVRFAEPALSHLREQALFTRPGGSFAARAFGNVVHRFLKVLSDRLCSGSSAEELEAELPAWEPRLHTGLRAEGLATNAAEAAVPNVLAMLRNALEDPVGAWLLGPRSGARNEVSPSAVLGYAPGTGNLRADRVFFGGFGPQQDPTPSTHLWIVDFKTTERGRRDEQSFLAEQRAKYQPQMQAYADEVRRAGYPVESILLALYFPALPSLVLWPAQGGELTESTLLP